MTHQASVNAAPQLDVGCPHCAERANGVATGLFSNKCLSCFLSLLRDAPEGGPRRAMSEHLRQRNSDGWPAVLEAARKEGLTL